MKKALIVVDVQNDFCEGGALAVQGGNQVANDIRDYLDDDAKAYYDTIVFTADWHKAPPETNGGHFSAKPDFKNSWPVHCVQGSEGALFHPAILQWVTYHNMFVKGDGRPDYSGFQAISYGGETLDQNLRRKGIEEVHVCGLSADYCVKETALDAKRLGYRTLILSSLTAAVHPGGIYEALRALYNEKV